MNVLIVGNGFDLVHNLPTKYSDFFMALKNRERWSSEQTPFFSDYGSLYNGGYDEIVSNYPGLAERIDKSTLGNIEKRLAGNTWAKYFSQCEAEIKGWIDVEREMKPIIELFRLVFESSDKIVVNRRSFGVENQLSVDSEVLCRRASLLYKFFQVSVQNKMISVINPYSSYTYGVLKEKMLEDLKNELDAFIETFRLYLLEIVDKIEINTNPVIESINADAIISFNYTNTERKYKNLEHAKVYHVHGSIHDRDSMVMGVDSVEGDSDNDYIFFVKYFQRIRRRIDPNYIDLLNVHAGDVMDVTVYGHSLDRTDEDIIKPFLLVANKVNIYCYDETDYERKVINLIGMLGRDRVEEAIFNREIEFYYAESGKRI